MIDAVDVIRFVGPQTFGRARDVVRAGLVEDATWHDDDGTVTATVSGSADDPYELRVETTVARGEFVRPVRSTCSCPLGGDCKHVAAALLTINARALAAEPRAAAPLAPPLPRTGGSTSPASPVTTTGRSPRRAPPRVCSSSCATRSPPHSPPVRAPPAGRCRPVPAACGSASAR